MIISNKLIKLAIEEAKKSNHQHKVGCIIFDKKTILSKGYNTSQKSVKKLHPKFQRFPYSVHAEVDAIIKARMDLKGCSMLVVRINKSGQLRLSKPCINCMKYIEYAGIKNIFYTIDKYPYVIKYE